MKRLSLLGAMKLSSYILKNIPEDNYILYGALVGDYLSGEDILRIENEVYDDIFDEDYDEYYFPLKRLISECGDNELAHTTLQLAMLRYINPSYGALIDLVGQNQVTPSTASLGSGRGVTLLESARINEEILQDGESEDLSVLMDASSRLELLLLARGQGELLDLSYEFDSVLYGFTQGHMILDRVLSEDCEIYTANNMKLYGYEDKANALVSMLNSMDNQDLDDFVRIIISGEKGSGRKAHAQYISACNERKLFITSYSYITEPNKGCEGSDKLKRILRACKLFDLDLCITDIVADDNTSFFIERLDNLYKKYINRGGLYLLTDTDVKPLALLHGRYINYSIDKPVGHIALDLWKGMLNENNLKAYDAEKLSEILTLNPKQLKRVIEQMVGKQPEIMSPEEIYRLCYEVLDDGRYENIHRIEPGYSMDDLKLDNKKLEVLNDICNQIIYRRKVYEDWGMREKYAYGRCVSILFAGPPGTGKTMAVHAIAKKLGLEMYKVDLSQVVDKYIGETEKRLEEVFKKAEKSNMILFFDEADSLIGRRGDATDSNSKGFNTQIAFILQRIEEYDGIVILATNLLANIDNAFMRRIRYIVQFDYPSVDIRMEIWKGAFAKAVPIDNDVDFEYLSSTFNISGAIIKNIVLNATFIAAAQNRPVNMEMLMKALLREASKDRGIISGVNLGRYEYLLRD